MRYQVTAVRSANWWALEFPNSPGVHSQVRRLAKVPEMAAGALSFSLDTEISVDQIDVDVTLPPALSRAVQDATRSRLDVVSATTTAKASMVTAVIAGASHGLSTRDIGQLLDISHQYAAKILQQGTNQ